MKKNFFSGCIFAVESSCDDTAIAIIQGQAVIYNIVLSQEHKKGVIPEYAARAHHLALFEYAKEAIKKLNAEAKIDLVAYTIKPGLIGSLFVGASFAKSFAYAMQVPSIGIDHLEGHILLPYWFYRSKKVTPSIQADQTAVTCDKNFDYICDESKGQYKTAEGLNEQFNEVSEEEDKSKNTQARGSKLYKACESIFVDAKQAFEISNTQIKQALPDEEILNQLVLEKSLNSNFVKNNAELQENGEAEPRTFNYSDPLKGEFHDLDKNKTELNRAAVALDISCENEKISFPYLCLLISGGHTMLILVLDIGKYRLLANTLDDALGEVLDKVARNIGLDYPGGPKIEQLAQLHRTQLLQEGYKRAFNKAYNNKPYVFPHVMRNRKDFSFSGLKTAAIQQINMQATLEQKAEFCYAFENHIAFLLGDKMEQAHKRLHNEITENRGDVNTYEFSVCDNEACNKKDFYKKDFDKTVLDKKVLDKKVFEKSCETKGCDIPPEGDDIAACSKKIAHWVISGGVAANKTIRAYLQQIASKNGVNLYFPPIHLCTDNAVMIAAVAQLKYQDEKQFDDEGILSAKPEASTSCFE